MKAKTYLLPFGSFSKMVKRFFVHFVPKSQGFCESEGFWLSRWLLLGDWLNITLLVGVEM